MRNEISKQGGIDYLVLLTSPTNDQNIIHLALSALSNYTNNQSQLLAIKRANGLQSITNLLSNQNLNIQYYALVFFHLFIDQSNINKEIVRALSFIPKCVGLMTSPHLPTQQLACQTIVTLLSNPNCLQSIHECGVLPQSLGLIDHSDQDIRSASLFILFKLLSTDSSFYPFIYFYTTLPN